MKKIFTLVLALCMVFSLAACGQQAAPAPAPIAVFLPGVVHAASKNAPKVHSKTVFFICYILLFVKIDILYFFHVLCTNSFFKDQENCNQGAVYPNKALRVGR